MKAFSILFLILLLPILSSKAEPTDPMVDIQAEEIEMDQKTGVVLFRGNVRVTRGKIRLFCDRLEAKYQKGKLISLNASGQVRAESETFVITARDAQFNAKDQRIDLTGHPTIKQGNNRLSGDKVSVWVDSDRVVVHQARGRFDPASLDPENTPQK